MRTTTHNGRVTPFGGTGSLDFLLIALDGYDTRLRAMQDQLAALREAVLAAMGQTEATAGAEAGGKGQGMVTLPPANGRATGLRSAKKNGSKAGKRPDHVAEAILALRFAATQDGHWAGGEAAEAMRAVRPVKNPGATLWHLVERGRLKRFADGTYAITEAGRDYLATHPPPQPPIKNF